jgi:hypothetical protein
VTIRVLVFLAVACIVGTVSAQPPKGQGLPRENGYTAFDAMAESQQRGDARRRWEVGRQMALIQDQRRWNGLAPTVPLVPTGPDRVTFYAYGNRWDLPRCRPVFEPWPYVPGYIWGYQFDDPAPQPVDRRQVQTGPNRWVSYPVYPGDSEYREEPVKRAPVAPERVEREELAPVPPPPPEPRGTPKRVGPRKY